MTPEMMAELKAKKEAGAARAAAAAAKENGLNGEASAGGVGQDQAHNNHNDNNIIINNNSSISRSSSGSSSSQHASLEALDITCVWPGRVFAMGPPSADTISFLNDAYAGRYLIWNLSDESSHRVNIGLQGQICDFHWAAPGKSQTPTLHALFRVCYSIHAWLSLSPEHAAFVFCSNGKTRTGIVLACLLRYCLRVATPLEGGCDREEGGREGRREGGREGGREDEGAPMSMRFLFSASCCSKACFLPSPPPSKQDSRLPSCHGSSLPPSLPPFLPPIHLGFKLFCERRCQAPLQDVLSKIPPTLVQYFNHFDEAQRLGAFPNRFPLRLASVRIDGVPVEDMPCVDVWDASNEKVREGGREGGKEGDS